MEADYIAARHTGQSLSLPEPDHNSYRKYDKELHKVVAAGVDELFHDAAYLL